MHSSRLLIALMVAVPLAACTSHEVREKETVVQQPAPVVKETIVQPPVVKETVIEQPVVRETVVQPAQVCYYSGSSYQSGSLSCQGGYRYYCSNGAWDSMSSRC